MRTCARCGGPLRAGTKAAICSRNPECIKAAKQSLYGDAKRAASREYQRDLPYEVWQAHNLWTSHGIAPAEKQAMLDAQGGCCYLCGEPLAYDEAVIDHDHRCCSDVTRTGRRRVTSCAYCRRGLACGECNTFIGRVGDDAERLIRMGRNLADALAAATARIAGKPQQLSLDVLKAS
jgi:hypothetical protein